MSGARTIDADQHADLEAALMAAGEVVRQSGQALVIGGGKLLATVVPRGDGTSVSMTLAGLERYARKSRLTAAEQAHLVSKWLAATRLNMRNAVVARGEIRNLVTGHGVLATEIPGARGSIFLPDTGLAMEIEATGDDPHRVYRLLQRVAVNPEVQAVLLVTTSRYQRPIAVGEKELIVARPLTGRQGYAH